MRAQRMWAGVVVALAACSNRSSCFGKGGGQHASGPTEEECIEWARRYCARLAFCAPVSVEVEYGSEATCIERSRPLCLSALRAPGTGSSLVSLAACAHAYETASCEDVVVGRPPPGCRVAGTQPAGAGCADDSQCAGADGSGHCKMNPNETCGACSTLGAVGDACDSDRDCQYGLVCYFSCMVPVAAGEPCDGMRRQCRQTLVCLDYKCSTPSRSGAPCSPRADACDRDHGLFCDPETKVCSPYATADVGAACGSGTLCRGGACATTDATETARCVPYAEDGAKCDPDRGRHCQAPARCEDGSCRTLEASRCR